MSGAEEVGFDIFAGSAADLLNRDMQRKDLRCQRHHSKLAVQLMPTAGANTATAAEHMLLKFAATNPEIGAYLNIRFDP